MNKKILFVALGIAILISSALLYALLMPNKGAIISDVSSNNQEASDSVATPPADDNPPASNTSEPGIYIEYSKDNVASTKGTKLLFFYAPWCPQCRAIEASIKADGIPNGVTVFKVDYDSNQKLRQQYGVTIQTTFVKIDDQGNKLASYVAYSEPQFSAVTRELLR